MVFLKLPRVSRATTLPAKEFQVYATLRAIVGCLTKFMLITKTLFDTGIKKLYYTWCCFEANSNQLNAL